MILMRKYLITICSLDFSSLEISLVSCTKKLTSAEVNEQNNKIAKVFIFSQIFKASTL